MNSYLCRRLYLSYETFTLQIYDGFFYNKPRLKEIQDVQLTTVHNRLTKLTQHFRRELVDFLGWQWIQFRNI